jgi:hypothetical protein
VIGVLTALGSALGAWLSRRRTRESKREDLTEMLEVGTPRMMEERP